MTEQTTPNNQPIRVAIADDHILVQKFVRRLINEQNDMTVVATAVNGQEAIEVAQTEKPDVLIMDLSMPVLDGLQASKTIQTLNLPTKVIILSMHDSNGLLQQAKRFGITDYIPKQEAGKALIPAIRNTFRPASASISPPAQ